MNLDLYIRRLNILVSEGKPLPKSIEWMIKGEFARLGYVVVGPILSSVYENFQEILRVLRDIKGDNGKWAPLYKGFPNSYPPEDEYIRKFIGYFGLIFGQDWSGELFDLDQYSANPVTEQRVQELFDKAIEDQKQRSGDTHTVWHTLTAYSLAEAEVVYSVWMYGLLYANNAIPVYLHDEVKSFLSKHPVKVDKVVFKETIALVGNIAWAREDYVTAMGLAKTPTDILRILASASGSDVSLMKDIKYPKLNKTAQKAILRRLNGWDKDVLIENMWPYRGLWKALLRVCHPSPKMTNVFLAATMLRDKKYKYQGWNSLVWGALDKEYVAEDLLMQRPGMYMRMLRKCLAVDPSCIETALVAAEKVPTKMVIQLAKYLGKDHTRTSRAITLKNGKIHVEESNPNALSETMASTVSSELIEVAASQLKALGSWEGKKIYVSPEMANMIVPFEVREMSESINLWTRGSRIPLPMDKTFRLFCFWMDKDDYYSVDVDLSTMFYSEEWGNVDHCSYYRKHPDGATHSGDIRSAPPPMGASEFIDLDLEKLKKRGVRYVMPTLNLYAGAEIQECFVGWMERVKDSNEFATFDPKTVVDKVDVDIPKLLEGNWYSVLLDLKEECIVICDVYLKGLSAMNTVSGMAGKAALQLKEIIRYNESRLTMMELVSLNMAGRGGELVEDPSEADLVFDKVSLEGLL